MSVATALLAASAALFLAALCKSHGAASYRDVAEVEGEALAEDGDGAATQGAGGGAAAAAAEAGAEGLQEPLLQQEQGGS